MTDSGPEAFRARLKRYRERALLTQQELAERAGLSVEAISSLERGARKHPLLATLRRIADALGLPEPDRAALLDAHIATPPAGSAPPRRAVSALPTPPTPLIGRERERGEVRDLLRSRARLVTLVGSGGVGKTRLALAVAADLAGDYPAGVWLVELAAVTDPTVVPGAVAAVFGLRVEPSRPLADTVADFLKDRELLMVLDTCEHLLAACAVLVGAWLRAAPGFRVVATSREGLQVNGEHYYWVPGLTTPDPGQPPPAELVGSYEAVRLFLARAQARHREFTLDERTGPVVAAICARLDGIPLAIELAAARVGSLPVTEIAARLDQSLRLLTGGPRDAPSRQRTLRATLDWSWDLLSAPERAVLRRLSTFAGRWTHEAAEAVVAGGEVEADAVMDLIGALVEKSLIIRETLPVVQPAPRGYASADEPRYRLLDTIGQYAREQLRVAGEAGPTQDRHAAYFLARAEDVDRSDLDSLKRWLERTELDLDELRATLAWLLERRDAAGTARLGFAFYEFCLLHGRFSEGSEWLVAILTRTGPAMAPAARAKLLVSAAILVRRAGNVALARSFLDDGIASWRKLGDPRGLASALKERGLLARDERDDLAASECLTESLALYRALDDPSQTASTLGCLAGLARFQGDLARGQVFADEGLTLARAVNDLGILGWALQAGAEVALDRGNFPLARALLSECLTSRQKGGRIYDLGCLLAPFAVLAIKDSALRGDAGSLRAGARVGCVLAGALDTQVRLVGIHVAPPQRAWLDGWLSVAQDALGSGAADHAREEGRALSRHAAEELMHRMAATSWSKNRVSP